MISIRPEEQKDHAAVRAVNELAFGQPEEAKIVDRLRESCGRSLSLVATQDEEVIGHILFTPVTLESGDVTLQGMGLAPMSVLPDYQRQGVGSALVKEGLSVLGKQVCPFVVVLGHAEYYPRFGFEPASKVGIKCQWEGVPDEAFMILIFDEKAMKGASGIAKYRDEFDEAM
jgi:putative acetyltransferase